MATAQSKTVSFETGRTGRASRGRTDVASTLAIAKKSHRSRIPQLTLAPATLIDKDHAGDCTRGTRDHQKRTLPKQETRLRAILRSRGLANPSSGYQVSRCLPDPSTWDYDAKTGSWRHHDAVLPKIAVLATTEEWHRTVPVRARPRSSAAVVVARRERSENPIPYTGGLILRWEAAEPQLFEKLPQRFISRSIRWCFAHDVRFTPQLLSNLGKSLVIQLCGVKGPSSWSCRDALCRRDEERSQTHKLGRPPL